MSNIFEDEIVKNNIPEFSVSALSLAIKKSIEGNFPQVKVKGEVGRVSTPASGHIYLDLKDERSVLSGVIWRGNVSSLEVFPEEGMEVKAVGRLTTFQGQSRYQIIVENIEPAGAGALMAILEKRKKIPGIYEHLAPKFQSKCCRYGYGISWNIIFV